MGFQDLPSPLIIHILSYVDDHVELCNVECTCKYLQSLSKTKTLWDGLCQKRWTCHRSPRANKQEYIRRHGIDAITVQVIHKIATHPEDKADELLKCVAFGKEGFDCCVKMLSYSIFASSQARTLGVAAQDLLSLLWIYCAFEYTFDLIHERVMVQDEGTKLEECAIAVNTVFFDAFRFLKDEAICGTEEDISEHLNLIGNSIQEKCSDSTSVRGKLDMVHQVFFEELHFRGNVQDYYDYNNSLLHSCLMQKKGIPLTLAILYKCICRRLGINVDIIGLPGHIIVKVVELDRFVDVFDGGATLTMVDIERIVNRYNLPMREEFLEPLTPVQVLQRIVNNIVNCFRQKRLSPPLLKRAVCLDRALSTLWATTPAQRLDRAHLASIWVAHWGYDTD
jgi:regulator of sirC expression with transglutaminase-like and TPR domain